MHAFVDNYIYLIILFMILKSKLKLNMKIHIFSSSLFLNAVLTVKSDEWFFLYSLLLRKKYFTFSCCVVLVIFKEEIW